MHSGKVLQTYLQRAKLLFNGKNVLQPKVVEIITDFIKEDENNYKQLRKVYQAIKAYFNMFIQTYFLKFIALLKKEVLI